MTWETAKQNADKVIQKIEDALQANIPKNITDVMNIVTKMSEVCGAIPNPNSEGQYCQLILYTCNKAETWGKISMSISKYNLYN